MASLTWALLSIGYLCLGLVLAAAAWQKLRPSKWSPPITDKRRIAWWYLSITLLALGWLPYLLYLGLETFAEEVR